MIKVSVNNQSFEIEKDTRVIEFINSYNLKYNSPILAVLVNNELRSLRHKIDADCDMKFIDYDTTEGVSIYRRSILFLFIRVCEELYPESNVVVEHSINQGVYCEIKNCKDIINDEMRQRIETRMRELVENKISFIKKKVTKEEAKEIYMSSEQPDKIGVLDSIDKDMVTIYSCGEWNDYFFGYLVPDTSFLTMFEIKVYEGGFLLRYPQKGNFNIIPQYNNQKKLFDIFSEFKHWNRILKVENVTMLNRIIERGEINTYARIAEALQEKKYAEIADKIKANPEKKIILIAGPTSSGKTTSSHRLAIQLMVDGVTPITIGLDDYFVNRDRTPIGDDGKPNYESLYSIDLDLFNKHLNMLLNGEEVELPIFDFITGMRKLTGRKVKLEENQVLIFEGIHALNERLTESISKENKFKIYVSALTSINIDDHNSIATSDARLLRRIVRDYQFRGHTPEKTLELWDSVRRGEDENIFPYQEEADVMFNSAMFYEISVLKPFAEPLLKKVDKTSPYYSQAKKLLDFLQYFEVVDSANVPINSIIREFIGGGCF
jgi:uridine kinase